MIAYNSEWIRNLFIREQVAEAFHQNCLDKAEWDGINRKYPVHFYSPNFYIRIGLCILTIAILLFSFGLFLLLFSGSIDHAIGGLAIFFGLLSYASLEYMVQNKKHFQSGVDDALLWISAASLFGGTSYITNAGDIANCMIILLISLYGSLRFADRVMSMVWYISLLGILFFACKALGDFGRAIAPFVIMVISAIIYLLAKRISRLKINQLYSNCLLLVSISALLGFYFSVNYYVVRELGIGMFHLNISENEPMPPGWLFWLFTLVIPFFYIIRGLQNKDIVLIRIGLLLTAAIIFTVRYYYSVASIEVILAVAGIILIIVSYGLTRYLKTPKYGFTNLEPVSAEAAEKLRIESILLAQTFTSQPAASDGTRFGGGSFGGGGASDEF